MRRPRSADLIVVGTHGRTGIERWVLGSVAQQVVREAGCSVEVVREPGAGATGKAAPAEDPRERSRRLDRGSVAPLLASPAGGPSFA
jgi:hypothetical protein